jgi:hypothetical protein
MIASRAIKQSLARHKFGVPIREFFPVPPLGFRAKLQLDRRSVPCPETKEFFPVPLPGFRAKLRPDRLPVPRPETKEFFPVPPPGFRAKLRLDRRSVPCPETKLPMAELPLEPGE